MTLDGGESGAYTYNELALLTRTMGFTTVNRVVDKLIGILRDSRSLHHASGYDMTAMMNSAIMTPNRADLQNRRRILAAMRLAQGKHAVIATGNLGPRTVTLGLLQAYMRVKGITIAKPDPTVRATLAYLTQKDPALAEYVEKGCHQLPEGELNGKEPWECVTL